MPAIEDGGTWGILGGAFDPVHNGHLNLARQVVEAANLTGGVFIPTSTHPFKDDKQTTAYEHRVAMLRLALEPFDNLLLCEIEAEEQLSGYTLDTIRALKEKYEKASFRFVIGADNLSQFPSWYEPASLLREVILLVGSRPGFELEADWQFPRDRIELISIEPTDVSSSAVRASLRERPAQPSLDHFLPAPVREYIKLHGLYR